MFERKSAFVRWMIRSGVALVVLRAQHNPLFGTCCSAVLVSRTLATLPKGTGGLTDV
jgi:hypothetical protein